MSIERCFVAGIMCFVIALSGCASTSEIGAETPDQPANGSEDSVPTTNTTGGGSEPANNPEDSIAMTDDTGELPQPASDDALCVVVNDHLDQILAGESVDNQDEFLEELPEELASDLQTLTELGISRSEEEYWSAENFLSSDLVKERNALIERIDSHTTNQCGVPYLRAAAHLAVGCTPFLDELEFACTDPRVSLDDIKTFEQSEQALFEWFETQSSDSSATDRFSEIGSAIS